MTRTRAAPRRVSVVVPVGPAAEMLARQLECLARQDYDGAWEVIVADNVAGERGADLARRWCDRLPALRVIDASARKGANHARNAGAGAASGDFLAFCDADDEVDEGWLTALARAAREADMVGGSLDVVTLNDASVRMWRGRRNRSDRLEVWGGVLPVAVGGNCGIWAEALAAVGGWNEAYARLEDVELSVRLQLAGRSLVFAPDAVVRYRYRDSLGALMRQFYEWGCADVRIQRDLRGRGLAASLPRDTAWRAARLLWHAPDVVRSRGRRGRWLAQLARLGGRLGGTCATWLGPTGRSR